jgi:MscS family membrane protein
MNSFLRRILPLLLCCLSLSAPGWGQKSLSQILQAPGEPTKAGEGSPTDPLGRQTPNGTLFGFLQAVQAGNFPMAAQYLQLSPARRADKGEQLATQLKAVLDGAFVGSLRAISTNPEGTVQPGLPSDHERVGTLSVDDSEADVILVRVNDPNAGKIWLFSADTLAKVPEFYELVHAHQVETHVPHALVKTQFLGMPVWLWLALLLAIPVAAGLAWVLLELVVLPLMLWRKHRKQPQLADWRKVSGPVWLVVAVLIHRILASYLGMPLLHRHYDFMTARVVLIIAAGWLALRVVARGMERLRDRAIARGSTGTGSLVLLGQRMLKVVVVLFAGLAVMGALGFNLTTALAGLGIGGLAIGFGAQKTIENLFGGISLLGDEVIRVGDTCNFNGRVGSVEDISLRSTRIRTVERTELSIPNGTLATMNVENLTRRDKILFNPKMGLRYETTPDQLRYVLTEARRLLYQHPKIETASARIRFSGLEDSWLGLEVFSYVLTRDMAEFTAIREDILLRLMEIVADAGTGFAFPSQTVYLGQDTGVDKAKAGQAEERVRQWREQKQLPFPDFAATEISEIRDSLPYPPPESSLNRENG